MLNNCFNTFKENNFLSLNILITFQELFLNVFYSVFPNLFFISYNFVYFWFFHAKLSLIIYYETWMNRHISYTKNAWPFRNLFSVNVLKSLFFQHVFGLSFKCITFFFNFTIAFRFIFIRMKPYISKIKKIIRYSLRDRPMRFQTLL